MSHYIIDGYNLLFFLNKEASESPLLIYRDNLIQDLCRIHASYQRPIEFTLIFDAHNRPKSEVIHETLSQRSHQGPIEIIYTSVGETADRYIENFFHTFAKRQQDILVTSDKSLTRLVRCMGYHVISVAQFSQTILRNQKKLIVHESRLYQSIQQIRKPQVKNQALHTPNSSLQHTSLSFDTGDVLPSLGDTTAWQKIFEEKFKQLTQERQKKKR